MSPASPETEPFPAPPPLSQLLHLCLLNTALLLPSHLRTALLAPAPFHLQGALESNEPLYKHLANALLTCTETNALSSTVFELVTTLKEVMRCLKFKLHVQEPFFSQLEAGSKTIEGRCAIGAYNSILPGDLLLFNNVLTQVVTLPVCFTGEIEDDYSSFNEGVCHHLMMWHADVALENSSSNQGGGQQSKMVNHYNSFDEMLKAEGLDQVLPGVTSFEEGVAIYRQFYSEEKELSGGVLAIHIENASEGRQPLTMVRIILEELAVYGVEALQGFVADVLV